MSVMARELMPEGIIRFVEDDRIQQCFKRLKRIEDTFAATSEEFMHYYNKGNSEFFDVIDATSSRVFAVICKISQGTRSIATVICTDQTSTLYSIYSISDEERRKIGSVSCLNWDYGITLPDLYEGDRFWRIYQCHLRSKFIRHTRCVAPSRNLGIWHYKPRGNIDLLLKFDHSRFGLRERRDFIQTCADRSEIACIVVDGKDVVGFGMLSKAEGNRRLLGPIYAVSDEWGGFIVDYLLGKAKRKCPDEDIVAYIIDDSPGSRLLPFRGFVKTEWWARISTRGNYGLIRDNVVAMGSLLFDAC